MGHLLGSTSSNVFGLDSSRHDGFQCLVNPIGLGYGISFMIIASVWSFLTDRAGRPGMESTHKTIQAYLSITRK